MVERAVAVVINARMKKRDMRWKRDNAIAVVTLRVQQINARWQTPSVVAYSLIFGGTHVNRKCRILFITVEVIVIHKVHFALGIYDKGRAPLTGD